MRPRHPLLIVSPLALVLVLAGCGGGVLGESGSPAASVPTETSPDASGSAAASPSESAAASGGERPSAPAGEQTTITIQPAEGSDLSGQVILTEYGSWTNVQIQVEGGSSEELWAEIRVGGCTDAAVQPMAVRVPVEDGEATFDIPVPYSAMVQLPHSVVLTPGEEENEILGCADLAVSAGSPSPSPSASPESS